jgi:tetratricopeptide (TPR) repeat protein
MKIYSKSIYFLSTFFFLFFSTSLIHINESIAYEYEGWEMEFSGYEIAKMTAEKQNKPLILYFYLNPDVLSEIMTNEYIDNDEVKKFLKDIPKVLIDEAYDKDYHGLARELGFNSFPAFLISIPSLNTKFHKVQPFSEKPQMTTDEFIGEIRKYITYHYNINAHTLYTNKNYEKALELLKKSIAFDTVNPYTYHVMGVIYHAIGVEKNDPDSLKLAEENYKKVLELDPENEEVKDELKKLTKKY